VAGQLRAGIRQIDFGLVSTLDVNFEAQCGR